jgi:hypothetical protein
MFGLVSKKKLIKKLEENRDFAQRDADKTGDVDSYDYYMGVVDTNTVIIDMLNSWGS